MRLIESILQSENMNQAIRAVQRNKGSAGIDGVTVGDLESYWDKHQEEITEAILNMKYKPQPVRRVYIPKPNGKKRPLGIPTVMDRAIQQAVAQCSISSLTRRLVIVVLVFVKAEVHMMPSCRH